MSKKSHSGLKRTLAWMLTVAMMAQGCVVYADDFTSEPEAADVAEAVSETVDTSADSDLEFADDGENTSTDENAPEISDEDIDAEVTADDQQNADDSSAAAVFSDGSDDAIVSDGAEAVGDTEVKPAETGDITIAGDAKYSYARFRDTNNYYRFAVAVYPSNAAELTMNMGDTRAIDHMIMYNTKKYPSLGSITNADWSCGKNKAGETYGSTSNSVGYFSEGEWEVTEETPTDGSEHVVEIVKASNNKVIGIKAVGEGDAVVTFSWKVTSGTYLDQVSSYTSSFKVHVAETRPVVNVGDSFTVSGTMSTPSLANSKGKATIWGDNAELDADISDSDAGVSSCNASWRVWSDTGMITHRAYMDYWQAVGKSVTTSTSSTYIKAQSALTDTLYCPVNAPKDGIYINKMTSTRTSGSVPKYVGENLVFDGVSSSAGLNIYFVNVKNKTKIPCNENGFRWTSSNPSVVRISSMDEDKIVLYADKEPGTAVLTGSYKNISIKIPFIVKGFQIEEESNPNSTEAKTLPYVMYMSTDDADGNGRQVKYSVYDDNGDARENATITWGVENEEIASIDFDGVLSAKKDGITTVTATYTYIDNNNKPKETTVNIKLVVTGDGKLELDPELKVIKGNTAQINYTATFGGEEVTNPDINWTIDEKKDQKVATVDESGVVTAHDYGEATVNASWIADNGKTYTASMVVKVVPEGFFIAQSDITLVQGQTTEVAYRIMKFGDLVAGRMNYDTAECKNADSVTWGTSDSSIATVKNGVITAGNEAGDAVIKAYWEDEDGTTYKKEINVTVTGDALPTAVAGKVVKVIGTAGAKDGVHSWKSGYYTNGDSTAKWNSSEFNLSVTGTTAEAEVTGVNPTWNKVYLTHSYQVAMEGADKLFTVNEGLCVNGVTGENNLYLDQTEVNLPYGSAADTATINAVVYDNKNANTDPAVKWTSSDSSVVTVAASNKDQTKATVTAVVPGTATITAEWNGLKATCKVNVTSDPLMFIDPAKATVKQGSDLTINVEAWDGTQYVEKPEIVWASSDEEVATVKDGVVTAVGKGNAKITATWNGITETVVITVTATRSTGVSVKWNDSDNQDGVRPSKVKVQLTANNENYGDVVELSDTNNWAYTWSGLDVDAADGTAVVYRLKAVDTDSAYTAKVSGNTDDAFVVTYSHETEKTSVSASAEWNDNDDQDGIRPSSISVQLVADRKATGHKVTLDAAGKWSKTWTELPKNNNGKEIVYTVEYSRIPSAYTTKTTGSAAAGYKVTASYTPKTTSVAASVIWNDEDNRDGVRPTEVTAVLLANGKTTGKTLTLTAKDGWKGSFENLAVNEAGKAISYTLKAVDIDGYTCETAAGTNGLALTYTHKVGTVSVKASVKWDDADNQDGVRPESVTMQLFADGTKYGESVTVKADDDWTKIWNSLPAKNAGTDVKYTVEISGVSSDYTAEMSGNAADGYVLTASHTTAVADIPVSVTWNDIDDQDGIRPAEVETELYANGETTGKKLTLTAENGWKGSFEKLPVNAGGKAITYSLKSVSEVEGYKETSEGLTLTFSHETAVIDVTAVTEWADTNNQDGKRPFYYTVQLYANGNKSGAAVTLNTSNEFSKTWKGLQKNSAGKAIEYTVKASNLPEGYKTTVSGNAAEGFTVINTYVPSTVKVPVSVQWNDADNQDGVQPAEVTVELYADGQATGKTVTLNAANNWSAVFAEVSARKDGKQIEYKVVSKDVTGYTYEVTGNVLSQNGFVVTYTHTPEVVSITSNAVWKDNDNQDGIRPADTVLYLYANGKNIDKTVIKESGEWTTTWTGLPKYEAGKEIEYTIKASEAVGYAVNVTGYTAEYVHEAEKIDVVVKNTWDDAGNIMSARPLKVTAEIFANGISTGKTVTLMSANNWTVKVASLNKNSAGKAITYTAKLTAPAGYTISGTTADQNGNISVRATYKINKKFSMKLSATRFTYNGKVKKPKVTVKVGTKTLSSKYYTVTYRNNKNTGYATVLVQGKGSYARYAAKASFVIIPKKMRKPSVKSTAKKRMTARWVRDPQAAQYIIQYSRNKNFTGKTTKTVTISKNTIKARTFTGLTSNKNYYVRIRSVKVVNDKKLYSSWSKTARVKVK